ncbi:MAG TPA: DUF58 domain-containing protein [Anaerolineae bacterium]
MLFFDERWMTLLLFISVAGVILHIPAMSALGVLSIVIIAASIFLQRRVLDRVTYERRFNETRLFMGEIVDVACNLVNRSRLPIVSLQVDDNAPPGFQDADADSAERYKADERINLSQMTALKPGEHTARLTRLRAMRRGYYKFGAATLRAVDLLGLSMQERTDKPNDTLIVYPRVFTLDNLSLLTKDPFGAFAALRRLVEDPSRIMGARDYRFGDPFRQIHWKATAHAGSLQTRVCENTSEPTAVVMLNVTTFEEDWRGTDVERYEWTLSVAGSLAVWADENSCTIGLSSNGTAPSLPEALRVRPRRSPNQLARILESLAVMYSFTLTPFDMFLLAEQSRLPLGATLLVVTPVFTPRIVTALMRLNSLGKNIILIVVDRKAPDTQNLPFPVYYIPPPPDFWNGVVWNGQLKSSEPLVFDSARVDLPGEGTAA